MPNSGILQRQSEIIPKIFVKLGLLIVIFLCKREGVILSIGQWLLGMVRKKATLELTNWVLDFSRLGSSIAFLMWLIWCAKKERTCSLDGRFMQTQLPVNSAPLMNLSIFLKFMLSLMWTVSTSCAMIYPNYFIVYIWPCLYCSRHTTSLLAIACEMLIQAFSECGIMKETDLLLRNS